MTVERMLNEITSKELTEWMAFNKISPFTQDRSDYMIAQLLALISNMFRQKNSPPKKPTDFMPFSEKPKQSKKALINRIMGAFK